MNSLLPAFEFIEAVESDGLGMVYFAYHKSLDRRVAREGEAVADPYYGDQADFEVTWADVSVAAEALVARLLSDRS